MYGKVTWKLTLPYVNRICCIGMPNLPMGICCMSQETQTGSLYQPSGVGWGRRFKREEICVNLRSKYLNFMVSVYHPQ